MNHGTMMAHDDDINLNLAVVSKDLHVKKNVTRFSFGVNDVQELRWWSLNGLLAFLQYLICKIIKLAAYLWDN